jgi:CheY-like chemotaxis protein
MKKVLFVDDNQVLSRLSCDILQREGYQAVPAFSAEEALEAFERENFDLLITDFRLGPMDGLQLARAIHDKRPHIPVIMVTAYGPIEGREIRKCLSKEQLFPALLEEIRTCLCEVDITSEQPV